MFDYVFSEQGLNKHVRKGGMCDIYEFIDWDLMRFFWFVGGVQVSVPKARTCIDDCIVP